jgi:hypothetical protein
MRSIGVANVSDRMLNRVKKRSNIPFSGNLYATRNWLSLSLVSTNVVAAGNAFTGS